MKGPRLCTGVGVEEEAAAKQALQPPAAQAKRDGGKPPLCEWRARAEGDGLELVQQHPVTHVAWHARGDYFASVAPTGNTQVRWMRHAPSFPEPACGLSLKPLVAAFAACRHVVCMMQPYDASVHTPLEGGHGINGL